MPKVHDTRLQNAIELLERLARGPASVETQDAKRSYELWSWSWVLRHFIELQPELKKLHQKGELEKRLSPNTRRVLSGDITPAYPKNDPFARLRAAKEKLEP